MLVERTLKSVLGALMLLMVTVVFAQVLLRYLTYQPVAWTEELARFSFIWLCLIGAAEGARRGAHFAVDLLPRNLGGLPGRLLRSAIKVLEAFLYGTVAWGGYLILDVVKYQQSVTLDLPMTYAYAAIAVGMGLMAAFAISRAIGEFRDKGRPS